MEVFIIEFLCYILYVFLFILYVVFQDIIINGYIIDKNIIVSLKKLFMEDFFFFE